MGGRRPSGRGGPCSRAHGRDRSASCGNDQGSGRTREEEALEPMLRKFTKRRRLVVLLAVVSVVALVLVGRRLNATKVGGQQPAEPFRIAGNFYYVGANDVAAFLLTGPEGHVVLDGGYPTTAR